MEYKKLGPTNQKIPALGIGTWKMGIDPEQEKESIKFALNNGIRFIDTAEMYATEGLVGESIKGEKDIFIATKVSPSHFHYDEIINSCNESLKKLGIKQIDLYQLHWPNHRIPIEETMRAMEHLVDSGKIRYIGVSNFSISELVEAQNSMKKYEIVSNQVEYSLLVREIEKELLPFCNKENITVIAYSPFAKGALFKYDKVLEVLQRIGSKHEKTAAQVALNWLISKKNVVAIPKASSKHHVEEILGSSDWKLSSKEMAEINQIKERTAPLIHLLNPVLKNTSGWSNMMQSFYEKRNKKDHSKSNTTNSSKKK